jgi:HlyD family secretion protein
VARIEVARTRLAQVQAGAKSSEIAAQRAHIERLQAEFENAQIEHRRTQSLGDVASPSQRDAARLRVDSASGSLRQARETLASLTEVRPVDVAVARAELQAAIGDEARALAEYEASLIRSPIDGRVLKIFAWPGEEVRAEGVMELARTDPMFVVAEVAESDLPRVRTGQRARISTAGLPSPVQGTVTRIGLKVLQNQLMPLDPANFSDGRVGEVWIKLEDSRLVAHLIHLRVDVVIQP